MIPETLTGAAFWLPLAFGVVMAGAMLAYVILDGYDLGVGIWLLTTPEDAEQDRMIDSIGPFWDANETWLVLGIGLLLVAFPVAHGVILGALYLPVAFMLVGLTLRGVAFDFRVKADALHKPLWNRAFSAGSWLAALSQGVMLGQLVTGFSGTAWGWVYSFAIGFGLAAGYALLGAGWLLMKTEGALQARAVGWAKKALIGTGAGIAAVSVATPLLSKQIFAKWFSLENFFALVPIPLMTAAVLTLLWIFLVRLKLDVERRNQRGLRRWSWAPFAGAVALFSLAFLGLAYSLFPWLVVDRLTFWQAASATESLQVIFWGVLVVVPAIIAYTVYAYRVFWGKSEALSYY